MDKEASEMRTIICDKCGAEISENYVTVLKGINLCSELIDIDLCSDCYELLDDWLGVRPDGTIKVNKKKL